jgi:hypothetical protein
MCSLSLLWSQEPATGPYPEHMHTTILYPTNTGISVK